MSIEGNECICVLTPRPDTPGIIAADCPVHDVPKYVLRCDKCHEEMMPSRFKTCRTCAPKLYEPKACKSCLVILHFEVFESGRGLCHECIKKKDLELGRIEVEQNNLRFNVNNFQYVGSSYHGEVKVIYVWSETVKSTICIPYGVESNHRMDRMPEVLRRVLVEAEAELAGKQVLFLEIETPQFPSGLEKNLKGK